MRVAPTAAWAMMLALPLAPMAAPETQANEGPAEAALTAAEPPRPPAQVAATPGERRGARAVAVRRAAAAPADPGAMCRQAIQAAEREHRTSPGLLLAIGRVESGRADPRTGAFTPWPWTINAEGQGRHFESREEAIAAVQALQARGVRVIDVGCMQVNLHHHPQAFADLEQAFDPAANARYAALFLRRLHAARGDWELAAAHYHSATPERGDAYRLKVLAQWPAMAARLAAERQRETLAEAWSAGGGGAAGGTLQPIRINGFQARALALSGRPDLTGRNRAAVDALLPQVPPLRVVGRQSGSGRPVYVAELAEAPIGTGAGGGGRPATRR
jgi:hypothetical protein